MILPKKMAPNLSQLHQNVFLIFIYFISNLMFLTSSVISLYANFDSEQVNRTLLTLWLTGGATVWDHMHAGGRYFKYMQLNEFSFIWFNGTFFL